MVSIKQKPFLTYTFSVLYLLVVAVTYNSLEPNFIRIGYLISILGFAVCLVITIRSKETLHFPRLIYPMGAYLALRFLTISLAPYPILSFELVLRELIIFISFIFVFNSMRSTWQPKTWENALINFGLIFSFIELLLALFWHRTWWQITGTIFSLPPTGYRIPGIFLGHPNVTAGFINLVMPIMVVRLLQERGWGKRALWSLGFFPLLVTLYFTSSRAGMIAGILGVLTTIALFYGPGVLPRLLGENRKPFWEVINLRYLLIAIPLVLLGLGFILIFFVQSQTIASHAPTIISARSGIWGPALDIIKESPWIGSGPGSFSAFFAQLSKIPPGFATSHAHSILLQAAAETGILGLAIVLWIVTSVFIVFLRTWRTASPSVKFRLAAYAGAGVAIASHHALDYLLESPLYALSVLILISLTLHEAPPSERITPQRRRALLFPTTLLIVFLLGSLYTMIGANDYWDGIQSGREGLWEEAAEEICRASEKQNSIPLYGFQCGLANAQLYYQTGDPQNLEIASTLQQDMLENDPYWPIHWANLANYEWLSGEETAAIEHMQLALDLAPRNSTFALNLAWMKENSGDIEGATSTYLSALKINIWLQFSHIYSDSSLAKEALDQYQLDSSYEDTKPLALRGWEKLLLNEYAEAENLFTQAIEVNPNDSRAYAGLALVKQQSGRTEEALHELQVATFISGNSPPILHSAGLILWQQDQEEKAYQYFQRAFDAIDKRDYSSSYYYRTYYRFFLISDLAPQLRRGDISPEMIESFNRLAQHLEETGNEDDARTIKKRLELEVGTN